MSFTSSFWSIATIKPTIFDLEENVEYKRRIRGKLVFRNDSAMLSKGTVITINNVATISLHCKQDLKLAHEHRFILLYFLFRQQAYMTRISSYKRKKNCYILWYQYIPCIIFPFVSPSLDFKCEMHSGDSGNWHLIKKYFRKMLLAELHGFVFLSSFWFQLCVPFKLLVLPISWLYKEAKKVLHYQAENKKLEAEEPSKLGKGKQMFQMKT